MNHYAEIVLSIHRSMLLTAAQKSYLVAALGSVTPVQPTPTGWDKTVLSERPGTGEMLEALALSLSSSLGEKKLHRQYKAEKDGEISQLQSALDSLQAELERLQAALSHQQEDFLKDQEGHRLELEKLKQQNVNEVEVLIQTHLTEIEKLESNHFQEIEALKQIQLQEIETLTQNYVEETETIKQNHSLELEAQNQDHFQKTQALKQAHMSTVEELKQDQANKQLELTEKDQTIRTLSSQLKEIYSSTAWKMVQQLWRIQVRMRSYRAFARLEGWIRTRITQGQQNKQQSIQQAPSLRDDPHASVQPAPSQMPKDKSDRFIVQYLSNDHNDRVILLTPTFFDWDGNNMFRGGAERYLIELSHLIKSSWI